MTTGIRALCSVSHAVRPPVWPPSSGAKWQELTHSPHVQPRGRLTHDSIATFDLYRYKLGTARGVRVRSPSVTCDLLVPEGAERQVDGGAASGCQQCACYTNQQPAAMRRG